MNNASCPVGVLSARGPIGAIFAYSSSLDSYKTLTESATIMANTRNLLR